jgi:serine/threonine protein kinase
VIGQGGMGTVFLAEQTSLGRKVAVKILHRDARAQDSSVGRFKRESHTIARLEHQYIIPIYDVGEYTGDHYIVMQYINGITLHDIIRLYRKDSTYPTLEHIDDHRCKYSNNVEPLSDKYKNYIEFICTTISKISEALAYAHSNGIIHRDVKPSNILIRNDSEPVLLDFGICKDVHDIRTTMTGEYLGTPIYSSPEQLFGDSSSLDERTDIYSIGITLYELLTGHLPYEGDSFATIIGNIKNKLPTDPSKYRPDLPADLVAIMTTASNSQIKWRYSSVKLLSGDLNAFLRFQPISARPPSLFRRSYIYLKFNGAISVGILSMVVLLSILFYSTVITSYLQRSRSDNIVYEGLTMLKNGNNDNAKYLFKKALELNPSSIKAFSELEYMKYKEDEDIERFQAEVKNMLNKHPHDIRLLNTMAFIYYKKNDRKEMLRYVNKVLKNEPRNYNANYMYAYDGIDNADTCESALTYLKKYQEHYPDEHLMPGYLGLKCAVEKNYKIAIEHLTEASQIVPSRYRRALATALFVAEEYERALEEFNKLLETYPNDAEIHGNLSVIYGKQDKYYEAYEHIRKAHEIQPWNSVNKDLLDIYKKKSRYLSLQYKKRGYELFDKEKYRESFEELRKGISFDPKDSQMYQIAGLALTFVKDYELALKYLKDANRIAPSKKLREQIKTAKKLQAMNIDSN